MAGAKDDRRDAFVLADSLRTDRQAYRRVKLQGEQLFEIRELSRLHDELSTELVRMANQFRELLQRYYPQFLQICPELDRPWVWELWELAPNPDKARGLRGQTVEQLLKKHRIRRLKPKDVMSVLQKASFELAPGSQAAIEIHIQLLLPRLKVTREQQKNCLKRLEKRLKQMEEDGDDQDGPGSTTGTWSKDVQIIRSMPGIGPGVASILIAEAPEAIQQRDYPVLRAMAGVAPVTRQSGKRCVVGMRRGCNRRLRNALYHWVRVSIMIDPVSKALYEKLRAKGHGWARALRGVGDRLLAVMMAMLRSGALYDPRLRQAEPALNG